MASLQQQQQQHTSQGNTANVKLEASSSNAAFSPETSPIHGQQAWVVLDLYGQVVQSSSTSDNTTVPSIIKDAPTLYKMLVESTPLTMNGGGLNRMTITFDGSSNNGHDGGDDDTSGQAPPTSSPPTSSVAVTSSSATGSSSSVLRYVVARDENHIYLIQTKGL